jgi:hypothetical protein
VDRILKDTKPAGLPVELPTNYDLVLNLKRAQAMELTIPQSALRQVAEVIQQLASPSGAGQRRSNRVTSLEPGPGRYPAGRGILAERK